MPLPPLTPEQRAAALAAAARARKERAEVKNRLKRGSASLVQILKMAQSDDIIGKMRVSALLESLPGVGSARARQIMERLGISETRRIRGLGANQREALMAEFGWDDAREPHADQEPTGNSTQDRLPATEGQQAGEVPSEIPVGIYLDTDDEATIEQVVQLVDLLVSQLGYEGPLRVTHEHGSFIRYSWAKVKQVLTSDDVKELVGKTEQALQARYLESYRADVDNTIADTIAKLLVALEGAPNACICAGSVLLIKYAGSEGPIILTKHLSPSELGALERFPGIQQDPRRVLESLAIALASDTGEQSGEE